MNDIVKLAVDAYKGSVEKYSTKEANEAVYQALLEANNGKTYLDFRDIRDGKCGALFTLVEEILANTVAEGLDSNMYFNTMVDYRNIALGDQNLFVVEDANLFEVAEIAEGTQAIRRQRLGGAKEVSIPTTVKAVRIYEELNRVLSGKVDFNKMIAKVGASMEAQILNDVYAAWDGIVANDIGGAAYFVSNAANAYDEDTMLEIIEHVEAAANGKQVTLVGTKMAVRNLAQSIMPEIGKADLYNMGYFGNFFGSPVVALPQRHKIGTTDFILPDNQIIAIATDIKPVKMVTEGNPLIIPGDPLKNMDLTQEYFYADKYGVGIVVPANSGIGVYEFK